jgi:vitamin B12 transporter
MFIPKQAHFSPVIGTIVLIAACTLVIGALGASAETGTDEKLYLAPEIVVTASRIEWPVDKTASFITIITRDDIRKGHPESVGELLRSASGLDIVQSGSRGKALSLFIRGANSNHCLVMLDGVPLNDPTTGAFDFSGFDAAAIDRIEIVRGPNGILYGSNAIGGVINIITSTKVEGAKRSVSLAGGSLRSAEGAASIAGGSAFSHYSFALSGATTDGREANDFYRNTSFAGFISSKVTPTSSVSVSLRYSAADIGLRGPRFDPDPNAEQGGGHFLISAAYEQSVTGKWRHNLRTSFYTREITWDDPLDSLDTGPLPGDAFSEINSDVKNIMWQNDLRFSDNVWMISGVEWKEEQTTNSGYSPYGTTSFDDKISTASIFANGIVDGGRFPTASAGVRVDDHSEFGAVSTYKFSLSSPLPWIGTVLKGSIGTGFRSPSLNELYYPGYGNPNLAPERTRGWDCGIRQDVERAHASFELAYFNNVYRNLESGHVARGQYRRGPKLRG